MNFTEAYLEMVNGHKVQSTKWGPEDYIYIEDDQLRSDSGSPYASMIGGSELFGDWRKYEPIRFILQEQQVKDILFYLSIVEEAEDVSLSPLERQNIDNLSRIILEQMKEELSR